MAEIDKTLPTTDLPPVIAPDVEIPVADETKLIETEGIEATELPDGGMDINFDPSSKPQIPGTEGHFDNLADLLPDDILTPIGSDMQADYTDYKQSRKEFNDGGLTKTIPPKRGPNPQGLPSALYNGIMRPRSY